MSLIRAPAWAGAVPMRIPSTQVRTMAVRGMTVLLRCLAATRSGARYQRAPLRVAAKLKRPDTIQNATEPALVRIIRFHAATEVLKLQVADKRGRNRVVIRNVERTNDATQAQGAHFARDGALAEPLDHEIAVGLHGHDGTGDGIGEGLVDVVLSGTLETAIHVQIWIQV